MPMCDFKCKCGYEEDDVFTHTPLSKKPRMTCPKCNKRMKVKFPLQMQMDEKVDHPRLPRPDDRLKVRTKAQEAENERQRSGIFPDVPDQRF